MKLHYVIGILFAGLTVAGSAQPSAQNAAPGPGQLFLIPEGRTVYDVVNHVTWLADANLPAKTLPDGRNFRFGLPLCDGSSTGPAELPEPCVNLSGSMNYASAVAWVAGMNAAHYLGHSDWQLPTTPPHDPSCSATGTNGDSFAWGCYGNALGYLYYRALDLKAPNTAVPIPDSGVGPFSNFQPYFYWSQSNGGDPSAPNNIPVFSFNSGSQGGATTGNFMYVLPMITGETLGTPIPGGSNLHVNPDGKTVYDPETNVAWLANANLAATEKFGLPCGVPSVSTICIGRDGAMNWPSANQFILNMNAYDNGAGYLGQTNWQLPPVAPSCPMFGCGGDPNPMGNLYYDQLKFSAGDPVVATPDIAVGPFHHVQPYLYWSCQADKIQDACAAADSNLTAEWGFSFGNGFLGTEGLEAAC